MSRYYDKVINEFKDYVNKCDSKAIQSVYWFLKQANGEYGASQAVTIPETEMLIIRDLIDKFRHDCECHDKYLYEGLSPEIKGMYIAEKQRPKKVRLRKK